MLTNFPGAPTAWLPLIAPSPTSRGGPCSRVHRSRPRGAEAPARPTPVTPAARGLLSETGDRPPGARSEPRGRRPRARGPHARAVCPRPGRLPPVGLGQTSRSSRELHRPRMRWDQVDDGRSAHARDLRPIGSSGREVAANHRASRVGARFLLPGAWSRVSIRTGELRAVPRATCREGRPPPSPTRGRAAGLPPRCSW